MNWGVGKEAPARGYDDSPPGLWSSERTRTGFLKRPGKSGHFYLASILPHFTESELSLRHATASYTEKQKRFRGKSTGGGGPEATPGLAVMDLHMLSLSSH
ncbi:hypothetical protein E2C01_010639 [Portunus trituberculatus]|uniref:Uncharacterized protein n=1 Tax=Portunus trituberculatus TaxID=210409 RepID=A0A5B7D962_PORTR|nr:hypothetical protein [Portunus trituberculatus]